MWLTCSSVGRKFIMALTGACLVLFVTFHCVMNAVAIVWPAAYNVICEFLGANWYALIASVGLAVLFVIHIIYASWLTILNRKARGNVRYEINKRPAGVEWSSKNMYVLGIVVLAFLVIHLIQFWAKMQLVEIRGVEPVIPPQAGTLFLQEAFSLPWTLIVYCIGFIALWFHMNHGFWSMFQSVGWDSTVWIPRLKKIGCWWTSIVVLCFIAQGIVFTVHANNDYYKTDNALRNQYLGMLLAEYGEAPSQNIEYADFAKSINSNFEALNEMDEQQKGYYASMDPNFTKTVAMITRIHEFINYLEGDKAETAPQNMLPPSAGYNSVNDPSVQEEEITVEETVETPANNNNN